MKLTFASLALAAALFPGVPLHAATFQCEKVLPEYQEAEPCPEEVPAEQGAEPGSLAPDPLADLGLLHKLKGTASYYSDFFDGRKTANGEIFHQKGYSCAHRTLPMGSLIEVRSLATGRSIKLRVNDRGPFKGGFTLDLSRAAAHYLGVDVAEDRRVEIRVLALPGDAPTSEVVQASMQGN